MHVPYIPLSKKQDSSSYISEDVLASQQKAFLSLPSDIKNNWDEWVGKLLDLNISSLWDMFSAEQIDAIGICIYNFLNLKTFILGDETGIGKGRILAGITRWAIKQNINVIFFTEREHLFSDFYRDLTDISTTDLTSIELFHSKAKIYSPNLELVLKSNLEDIRKIETNGFSKTTNLVFTNYSQISLKQHSKSKKPSLLKYAENSLLILDECHNAAGDSNTNKFLESLCKNSKHIIFSSATYLKDQSQLSLYSPYLSFDKESLFLLTKVLNNTIDNTLRKYFSLELTETLQFWRREHEPLKVGWNNILCELSEKQTSYLENYSTTINSLFNLINTSSKEDCFKELNLQKTWLLLGATINRLSRNLLLLLKVDTLVTSIEKTLENNHKAVVVIDSTFSSIITKVISNQSIDNFDNDDENEISFKKEYSLNFEQVLNYIIYNSIGKHLENFEHAISPSLMTEYKKLLNYISCFNDLDISPIDLIHSRLNDKNIKTLEISGRTFKVNNSGKIEPIVKTPKPIIVNSFNSGEADVIIITRAGAAGISLHSNPLFKDTRVRDLYELEITNRPTYRLQFLGRVNRKNQLFQPNFFSITTPLPFEQRILNIEQNKIYKLYSHINGDEPVLNENIFNLYTEYCNQGAYQFLFNNKHIAYQLGINIENNDEPFYFIDSLLKRCIILNQQQQNFLYDYLLLCAETEYLVSLNNYEPIKSENILIKTFWHTLTTEQQEKFKKAYQFIPSQSLNQFKFPWVGVIELQQTYQTTSVFELPIQEELEKNKNQNPSISKYISKFIDYLYKNNKYSFSYLNEVIKPRLNNLQIGKTISIPTETDGKIFGFIKNISIPNIPNNFTYDNIVLITIQTINPLLNNSVIYPNTTYQITLQQLLNNEHVIIYNTPIDWSLFSRPKKTYVRNNHFLVGNPIHVAFLHQCYQIGKISQLYVNDKNIMALKLPTYINNNFLLTMPKPLYKTSDILHTLYKLKTSNLSSIWQTDNSIKASLKLEHYIGGYYLYIANEIYTNKKIFDFSIKRYFTNLAKPTNGYKVFFFSYKDLAKIIYLLELRNIIWFISTKTN